MNKITNCMVLACFFCIALSCVFSMLIEPRESVMHTNRRMDIVSGQIERIRQHHAILIDNLNQRIKLLEKTDEYEAKFNSL